MSLRIHDLGPVEVEVDGGRRHLGARPQAVLAALLIRANERVSVEALTDAVWGEAAGTGSQSTLESHVWRVRQVLEPDRPHHTPPQVLVTDHGGYRLVLAAAGADSLEFMALDRQSRALIESDPQQALRWCDRALALWRGAPFGAWADSLWAATAVSRLMEVHDQLRIRRVQALLACGELEQAVVDSDTLTRDLPLNEDVWAQRMIALNRVGRADDALRAYRTVRHLMVEEIGLDPGVELQELHSRILGQDEHLRRPAAEDTIASPTARPGLSPRKLPPRTGPPETNLPRRLPHLIGRATELASLSRLVCTEGLVTVVGAAGCGKTRLAIEVARDCAKAFPDGVFLVDLGAVEQSGMLAEVVASVIGLAPAATGTVGAQLRRHLRDQRILLLLDNCEHLAPMLYDLIMEVLDDDSASHVLATSRQPLAVPGEITWPLSPLRTPAEVRTLHDLSPGDLLLPGSDQEADGLADSPALELFCARLGEADPTLLLDDAAMDVAAEICNGVDGLPLALELAAARVRTASLAEIADQVHTDPGGLGGIAGRGGDARRAGGGGDSRSGIGARDDHRRTVRQAIEWSHHLLSPQEQVVHRRLAVLRGGFTRSCACAVAGFAPLSGAEVPDLLESLVNRSLVVALRAEEPGEETTFRQLVTVRAHAAIALREADETRAAIDNRHAWLRGVLARRPDTGRADENGWYQSLDADFAAVRASLEFTLVEDPGPFGCFVLSRISNFWYHRGRMIEGLNWLQLAVPPPVGTDRIDELMTRLSLAGSQGMRGRFDLARPLLDDALAELEEVPADRRTDVVENLASLALVGALHHDFEMVAALGRRLHDLSVDGEPSYRLMADAVTCFAGITSTPPQVTADRAAELYELALAHGVLLACWICCIMVSSLAVHTGAPEEGLLWTQRMTQVQTRLGARPEAMPIEGRALAITATGCLREGVALFAASQLQSRRAGIGWPARPATRTQLEMAREELGELEFNEAWQAGLGMSAQEALGLG